MSVKEFKTVLEQAGFKTSEWEGKLKKLAGSEKNVKGIKTEIEAYIKKVKEAGGDTSKLELKFFLRYV